MIWGVDSSWGEARASVLMYFGRGNGKANLTREGTCIVAQQPRGRRSRHPTRGEGGVRIGGRVRDTIDAGTC